MRRIGVQYSAVQSVVELRADLAVLAILRHPHLLRYFGFASDADGNHAILMEHAHSSLEHILNDKHTAMTWASGFRRIAAEAADALAC